MSSWMNDAAVQNHNGVGFHLDPNTSTMLDPSAFMSNPSSFDPSQFQQQQMQQRMQNGGMRNGSPAFNNPVYQTNSSIPSKRPRPREDSLGTSPRQAPGMPPNSRSQTPQSAPPYSSFPGSNMGINTSAPQPYSHLQNGSANATPSPIMGNQLRPGAVPQRVSTASPHPFSPAAQQFPQASPSHSDHGSRVDTPQNNPYTQNSQFSQGFNQQQNYHPNAGRTSAPPQNVPPPMQPNMPLSQMNFRQQHAQQPGQQGTVDQQKMMYQMRLQQQLQAQNMMAAQQQQQRQSMPPNISPMEKAQMSGANGLFGGQRPQQPGQRSTNPDAFMKNLASFMAQRNLPVDMNPVVGDRSVTLSMLYMIVSKFGGYKKVTAQNGWQQVAQALQFHPMQHQSAPQQLRGHYERNLLMFEEALSINHQRQRAMMQQNSSGGMSVPGPQMSPTKNMSSQAMQQSPHYLQQSSQPQQHGQSTPVKQMAHTHHQQQPSLNGFSTPTPPQAQPQHPIGSQSHPRNNLSRNMDVTPPQNGPAFTIPSPVAVTKTASIALPSPQASTESSLRPPAPPVAQDYSLPEELEPKVRVLDTFGGVEVDSLQRLGSMLVQTKPDIPAVGDMGSIDIHALTMSLQCGIHSEVRLALDTLASLSVEHRLNLELRACEDLVETLIECAESQVELLAENAAEVSDVMLINSYDDVIRGCRSEQEFLQNVAEFGSLEYDLDRAVDRLICITTIIRNLSFYEPNHPSLADELVIKFLCVVMRYLGTRNMLLRTHSNTLDFMKDIIIFLSNLAQAIELPGREQALCLLHFLLAFAPSPPPNTAHSEKLNFSPYDPAIHRYLPPAIDSLAKLLARDEPNRTHYKMIFSSDITSSPPYDLLTKTFALAISAIPDEKVDSKRGRLLVVEARKPILMQSILAADIIASLAPGHSSGIARSWLSSEDGMSQNLCRLILILCLETSPHYGQQRPQGMPKGIEDEALLHITVGSISVLRRLAEKARDPEDPTSTVPVAAMPPKDMLMAALQIVQPRLQGVLKDLCTYAGMGI